MLIFRENREKLIFQRSQWKIGFLRVHRKGNIVRYMLLHNSYINVAIADILVYKKIHFDLLELTLENRQ